ncbi:glycoside hydrolase family 128 protein [Neolentinus lepideus HHB14362 ss-1]|uniref:Glycoside hydrolase family 128 protein n=1 Tax=Neolentinus lepideus HHB14362 ss-1 TaxID=1314782 RepID=A0A165RAI3_9AGAM|nr:glycoside hydrolase family 128 protein [Neolentinus lepideus HHB14362 ss-1]
MLYALLSTSVDYCNAYPRIESRAVANVSSSAKAGLAWPNGNTVDMAQYLSTEKVSWYYTWSPDEISEDSDLEFIPMLWGTNQEDDWTSSINDTIHSRKITAVLGMNEPQQSGQSNLTPQQGADMWRTYIEPLRAQGIRLGSPATSSAPSGKIWMQDWLQACDGGCTIDFVALHWYDINVTNFIQYVEDFHDTFGKPIWVTEWACQNFNDASDQCSVAEVFTFLNTTQSWMDSTDWVERYSWFGAMRDMQGVNEDDALMDASGEINSLGRQYVGAKATGPVPGLSSGLPLTNQRCQGSG